MPIQERGDQFGRGRQRIPLNQFINSETLIQQAFEQFLKKNLQLPTNAAAREEQRPLEDNAAYRGDLKGNV